MDADYISHVQLSELSPIEQARLIEKLTADGETSREIADRFDRSRYWVSNRKRLTNLPESVQTFVHKGDLSVRQALALEKAYRLKRTDSDSKGARRINVQDLVERAKDGTLTSDDIRERVNGLESDDNPAIFYLMRLGEKLKFGVTKDVEKRKKAHQSETNGHVKVLRAKECASRSLDLQAESRMVKIKAYLGIGAPKGKETMVDSYFAVRVFDRYLENASYFE